MAKSSLSERLDAVLLTDPERFVAPMHRDNMQWINICGLCNDVNELHKKLVEVEKLMLYLARSELQDSP